ncbi:hypothetical protein CCACVL1_16905 [Corchorus capsularis]|uniref:TF-B3 domain-containing protein n=1 Tax=Corchorus capsularis TaxID=210143 RepID=A0A1R3HUV1_COCAP|nr:hypothetical protein CCACVL1_16905 [Corchorus capsularis]
MKKSSKEAERDLLPFDNRPCFSVTPHESSQRLEIPPDFVRNHPPKPIPSKASSRRHQATPQVKEEEIDIDDLVEIIESNVQIANKTKIKTTTGQNPDQARVKKHNPSCFSAHLPQGNGSGGGGGGGRKYEKLNKEKMQKLAISELSHKKFKPSPPPKIIRNNISSSDGKTQTQLPLRHSSSSRLKTMAPVSSNGERVYDPTNEKTCHKYRNLESKKKISKSTAGRDVRPIDNRPCFYIILYPMTPEEASQSLEIPPDFVRNHLPNPIPSKAVLKDHSGDCWNISIIKKRNKTIMKHGWNQFYKDHCIRDKEFLFFRYNGDMSFNVQIFDISGREKKHVSTSRRAHQATPEVKEEEMDIVEVVELEIESHERSCCKQGKEEKNNNINGDKSNKSKEYLQSSSRFQLQIPSFQALLDKV